MENQIPIHAKIYDPTAKNFLFKQKASAKAECTVITCSKSETCGLYARGECAQLAILDSTHCPYGTRRTESGYTKQARGYREWINTRAEKHAAYINKLGSYKKKMAIVGEYVFLPYAHMNMNKALPFGRHGGPMVTGTHFIKLEQFNIDTVMSIVEFEPQALFGGTIKSYKDEVVPAFVKHLKDAMPKLYMQLEEKDPALVKRIQSMSNVGRKAYVRTLKPGTVVTKYHDSKDLKTQHWTWDGEYLTSTDCGMSFAIVEFEECTVRIKPKQDEVVVITNDNQVDEDTEYQE